VKALNFSHGNERFSTNPDGACTFGAVKDLFTKCHEDGGYFPMLRMARDRYYCLPKLDSPPGRTMTFRGREVIQWAINTCGRRVLL
jgi:hypothetical protein